MHFSTLLSSILLSSSPFTSARFLPSHLQPLTNAVVAARDYTTFGLMALRSASPIHFGVINAAGGNFWIGKVPKTICPAAFNSTCVNSTSTLFNVPDEYGTLGLDVLVEGGQKVFIDPVCGEVSYVCPHCPLPAGANATGWRVEDTGTFFSYLSWLGGTVFCPTGNYTTGTPYGAGPWKMYALLPGVMLPKNGSQCLGAQMVTLWDDGPSAWAYR